MCQLLLEKHQPDCKVSPWQLCSLASISNLSIVKLLISNGALEKDFDSWTLRLSLMKSLDYSRSRKSEKPSKEKVLTFLLKKALEQTKEEMVNVEMVEYLLNIGANMDKECISILK